MSLDFEAALERSRSSGKPATIQAETWAELWRVVRAANKHKDTLEMHHGVKFEGPDWTVDVLFPPRSP